jgi:methyl-accepting chemotaxis protein
MIFANTVVVFLSIQAFDNNTSIERKKSNDLIDIQLFDQQLQNTLNIYNDSIYLNPYKFQVQARYNDQVKTALQKVTDDNAEQLQNPDSLLTHITRNYNQLSTVFNQSNNLLQNGESEKATVTWASSLDLRRTIKTNTEQLSQQFKAQKQTAADTSTLASTITKVSILVTGVLATLFAGLCAWLLSAAIGQPLASAYRFAERVANGDLSGQLTLNNRDELGELARMLNRSVKTIAGLIESFNVGSAVEAAARSLKQISSEQANYSIAQVQRVSEVEQALQDLTGTVVSINSSAASVAEAATNTFNQAQAVDETSQQVSQTIQKLQIAVTEGAQTLETVNEDFINLSKQLQEVEQQSHNSQRVVEIIAQITQEIHILSLNAAIEAAGSGVYGERFQVIAKQIKELASHTAKSTEDITALLTIIRQSVQLTLEQSKKNLQSVSIAVETSKKADLLANETLELSWRNRLAVGEIVRAAQNSAQQATQIKATATQQQSANHQIQVSVNAIGQEVSVSAQRSSEVAHTSGNLDVMSRTLASRLAELKLATV